MINNDTKLLERTDCSDLISDEDYVMNASKSSFNESVFESRHTDMPLHYWQIRCGEWKVKPEYYLLMDVLKSKYHISENLAQEVVIEVDLFGYKEHRKWKNYISLVNPIIVRLCHHHPKLTA